MRFDLSFLSPPLGFDRAVTGVMTSHACPESDQSPVTGQRISLCSTILTSYRVQCQNPPGNRVLLSDWLVGNSARMRDSPGALVGANVAVTVTGWLTGQYFDAR